ncbi:hypothetical protein [Streptomyces sp. bgisy095]|uniref:hypothetical protein n=1 Tax=unclassified Streptomyces TaxID=2593676 RepID=UPI003D722F89
MITRAYLGSNPRPRSESPVAEEEAHRVIGASVLAGFGVTVYTRDAKGERMWTPGGELLTVVAVAGGAGRVSLLFALTGGAE